MYGPRDRNSFPRVIKALRRRWVVVVGRGDNRLNIVHAADVAEGAVRAAEHPAAVGQAYNLASEGDVTQQEYLDALSDALGLPRVWLRVPYSGAFTVGMLFELIGRLVNRSKSPVFSRYAVGLIGRSTRFRIDKAREQLDWRPRIHPLEGMRQTLAWFLDRDQIGRRA
jgi:nucleoside-diphosphate-sugar epimerase